LADIRPFRGVHYNQSLAKDLSAYICPPYDVISPQQHQELHTRSEYNFIRLESARETPQDTAADNKYTRSAETLRQWLEQGILTTDEKPVFYLHEHNFTCQGKKFRRRSLIARVRLEEWDKMIVRPHEGTLTEPRGERLSLLWSLQANTSPILAMYEDKDGLIRALLSKQERSKPFLTAKNVDSESHRVWAVADEAVTRQITESMVSQPVYIADGHHRYESALAYRNECRISERSASGDEAYNFVMMELVDFADPGLVILPPHRLVRGIHKAIMDELMTKLEVFFEVEKVYLDMSRLSKQVDDGLAGPGEVRLILFGVVHNALFVLKLRDFEAVSQMMPYFHSELYKKLDVSIVDHIILENLLALSAEKEKENLAFSYDTLMAVNRVLNQEYQLAFLLSPAKTETIKAVADSGDKMPRKSTYFYPKSPAGLIFNRLV
jgi:uncharacterized protein (DUF1015 family)